MDYIPLPILFGVAFLVCGALILPRMGVFEAVEPTSEKIPPVATVQSNVVPDANGNIGGATEPTVAELKMQVARLELEIKKLNVQLRDEKSKHIATVARLRAAQPPLGGSVMSTPAGQLPGGGEAAATASTGQFGAKPPNEPDADDDALPVVEEKSWVAVCVYEHIDPEFKDAQEHDPACMALLCGGCHDRVTRGYLSKQTVSRCRKDPWCLSNGRCHDSFDVSDSDFIVWMGG